jgi:hypothetical protein
VWLVTSKALDDAATRFGCRFRLASALDARKTDDFAVSRLGY